MTKGEGDAGWLGMKDAINDANAEAMNGRTRGRIQMASRSTLGELQPSGLDWLPEGYP